MKKNAFLSFALVLILGFGSLAFVSCAQKNETEEPERESVKVYFGSKFDAIAIDKMVRKYEKKTGVLIEPIISADDDDAALKSEIASSDPPLVYLTSIFSDEFNDKEEEKVVAVDSLGYGANKKVIYGIFGEETGERFLAALVKSSYADWKNVLREITSWIEKPRAMEIILGGKTFMTAGAKNKDTENLTGAFSFPGADIENSLLSIFAFGAEGNKLIVSDFLNYIEFMTDNLAGEFAPGIRGDSLVSKEYYGREVALDTFFAGKSVFTYIEINGDGGAASERLAENAENLFFFPIKFSSRLYKNVALTDEYVFKINDEFSDNEAAVAIHDYLAENSESLLAENESAAFSYYSSGDKGARLFLDEFVETWNVKVIVRTIAAALQNAVWDEEARNEYAENIKAARK
jgi:hypothetical protein